MTDLVEKLRNEITMVELAPEYCRELMKSAADEIEQLRAENEELKNLLREAHPYLMTTGWGSPGIDLPHRIDKAIGAK